MTHTAATCLILAITLPTMVRGNWQKRVESAQARREEGRARKARKGDREAHRQMASGLMSFLASPSADATCNPKMLHVWVDSDPRKSSGGGGDGGRAPAQDAGGGFGSDDDDGGDKKRGKKGGKKQSARRPQQGSAKKAHPRQGLKNSHHFDDDEGTSAADAQELCVRHFFFNKCAGSAAGNKKGGGKGSAALCKLQHMRDPTLALALKKSRDAEADIAASATAVIQTSAGDGEGEDIGAAPIAEDAGMSMLWYLPVHVKDEMEDGKGINEILQSHLSRSKLGAASIVYVVLGEKLLYDRNREGVMEESHSTAEKAKDGEKAPPRKHGRSRGESMAERKGSICDGDEEDDEASILLQFPASVLESILTYLPDMYTGNLPRLCKAWYAEIGRTSPNLWYELIMRRGLPLPVEKSAEGFLLPAGVDADTAGSPRDVCRDAFIAHYEAFRDMRAVHELFLKLQGQTSHDTSIAPTEACVINYNSSPGAPREGSGRSTSMKVWSEGKVLIAFKEDCTLRLFEAASAGASTLACRQTVSVIVSPEPRSKRGQWQMTGMDIDNQCIGCICQPSLAWRLCGEEPHDGIKSPVMRIIKREDLLCASGGGSDNRPVELHPDDVLSIDLRNAVCQHLLNDCFADLLSSTEESDTDLVDLLENEERSDLILYVSGDVVACSRGRFLFKGALLTRDMPGYEQVSFRTYLYSVSARKIAWSENIHVSLPFSYPFIRMFGQTKANASISSVLISHPDTLKTSKIDVSKDGAVEFYDMAFGSSQLAAITTEKRSWEDYDEDVQLNWSVTNALWRPALLTSTDIFITCNEVVYDAPRDDGILDLKKRTVVTFSFPTSTSIDSDCDWGGATTEVLTLKGRCRIDDMHPVGPDHVFLIGSMLPDEPNGRRSTQGGDGDDGNGENGENEDNDVAGEWFGVANDDDDDEEDGGSNDEENSGGGVTDEGGYCIFLVHIPSRKEIKRYMMTPASDPVHHSEPLFQFVSGPNTIGLEIAGAGGGLIMSGRGVRDIVGANTASNGRSDDVAPKSKKKKRQATRAKGRNKDGFARGMSGRG